MRIVRMVAVVALALTAVFSAVGLAVAAAAPAPGVPTTGSAGATASVPATAPLVTEAAQLPKVDVQLWPDDQEISGIAERASSLIVTAQLPGSVKLPATVRIPLPATAQVQWAGEIVGDDPNDDVPRAFIIGDGVGGQYVQISVEQTRVVQYEALYVRTRTESGRKTTDLRWVQSVPTAPVTFAVKTPPAAQDVRLTPVAVVPPVSNRRGEKLYTAGSVPLAVGRTFDLKVDYAAAGAAPAAPRGPGVNVSTLLPVLVVVLVLLAGLLAYALARQRPSGDE